MQKRVDKGKEVIAEKLNIPKDIVLNAPNITVLGDEEITIENHKGIVAFDRDLIKINTRVSPIIIKGENFEILYIGESTITISGKFKSIVYERD